MPTGVKYIGKAKEFKDRLYGTNIVFKPGEVHSIEDHIAKKLLAHTDTYASAKIPAGVKMVRAVVEERDDRRSEPPMLDFTRMPDGELRDFARIHYNENLPPHATHQTLVDRLVTFANRGI
jgi:hypothetical protein